MKTCPACHRSYDDEIRFCLEDGTTLERIGAPASPTWTMPAPPGFQAPPPPTLVMPVEPSMSTGGALLNIFIAPARAFASFRDVTTFSPAAVRFLVALPILLITLVVYNAMYLVRVSPERVGRVALEASPHSADLSPEAKERAVQMMQNPTYRLVASGMTFVRIIIVLFVSLPLGALIYWVGAIIFQARLKYMQALLVWTYAAIPAAVLWMFLSVLTLLVWPPTSVSRLALGASGVFPGNLGWLFTVTTIPAPVYVVAASTLDVFDFYGLTLGVIGLRKAGRMSWLGALVIVGVVWLIGVGWRIGTAGAISALTR
jgi:hypothetical protein